MICRDSYNKCQIIAAVTGLYGVNLAGICLDLGIPLSIKCVAGSYWYFFIILKIRNLILIYFYSLYYKSYVNSLGTTITTNSCEALSN